MRDEKQRAAAIQKASRARQKAHLEAHGVPLSGRAVLGIRPKRNRDRNLRQRAVPPEATDTEDDLPAATAKPVTLACGYVWRGPGLLVRATG